MGADMHALEVGNQAYFDDPLGFISRYGTHPSRDVTWIRDQFTGGQLEDFGYIKGVMLEDELSPDEALVLADSLILVANGHLTQKTRHDVYGLAAWIKHWAHMGHPIGGMH